METKTKIALFAAVLGAAFLWSGSARADYWTRHTRTSSSDILPEYFELENMAKSSDGVKLLYGTNRVGGVGDEAEANHTRHLLAFDGTNWEDLTDTAKNISGGVNDIQFDNMYADSSGNVWMSNHKDGERRLMKYDRSIGTSAMTAWASTIIADQAFPSGEENSLRINNLFTGPSNVMYAVAQGSSQLYLLYYDGSWHDSGITGTPLTDSGNQTREIFGIYNSVDGSFWIYSYHSSENEYANPAGGDVGIGIWRYKNSSWTQYSSADTTADGASLKNGVTDAFADSAGNVWVGTRYGVFKHDYASGNWYNWTKDNSNIFTNRVIKIQEDSDGRVWIIALEDENVADDNGGISIYNNDDASWDYYTSYNGEDALDDATNIFMIGGDEAWMFTGHGEVAMAAGIYQLVRDDSHTALYGQVAGTTVEKASLSQQKKSRVKKFKIWKHTRVKRKWKRKKMLYRGKATDNWYKALNLTVSSNIRYTVKISGKKKRRIIPTSGEPLRLDFN